MWSPSASSWGAVVNERLAQKQQPAIVPTDAKPFMLTPLVIAMPKPMAEALGYPEDADRLRRPARTCATANDGWASKGHPEWGAFKLGKTNPNFSTSGLSSTIAQYYAATGKQSRSHARRREPPDVDTFMRGVESAVVHYGDTTLSFLNNLYRNDRAGLGLTYVSAVAVEETSIIAYNRGNPDGILDPGEQPRAPRVPLVAVYPKDGTLFSDNPFFVLNAPWVDRGREEGGAAVRVVRAAAGESARVLELRLPARATPTSPSAEPISARFGVDPAQPSRDARRARTGGARAAHREVGRAAQGGAGAARHRRVGFDGRGGGDGETKLDLAQARVGRGAGAVQARRPRRPAHLLDQHLAARRQRDYLDLVPLGADLRQPRGDRRAHPQPRCRPKARRCTPRPRTRSRR